MKKKVIDGIVPEHGDINEEFQKVTEDVSRIIERFIEKKQAMDSSTLIEKRYKRFRQFGRGRWEI